MFLLPWISRMFLSGWWFQPLCKILVNGKDYFHFISKCCKSPCSVDACMYMDQLATLYIKWVISHSNLAESFPLKQNHSWEGLSHIYDGKKNVWNHQPAVEYWDRSENGEFTSGILKGSILHNNHVAAAVAHDNHSYHCYHQYYYIISKYHLLVLCYLKKEQTNNTLLICIYIWFFICI